MVRQPVTVCYPQEKLTAPERLRGHIVNDMDVCICCGMCARRCPAGALAVDRKGGTWSIDPYACVVCGECIESCPKHCLSMDTARTPVAEDKAPTEKTSRNSAGMGPVGQNCPTGPARERAVGPPRTKLCRFTTMNSTFPTMTAFF